MIEGVPEKCLECPILKVKLDRIKHFEQREADMTMELMTEDQEMSSVLEAVRRIPYADQMSDEEILHQIRASGSQVVEMTQRRTEELRHRLQRDLGALTFGCSGPLETSVMRNAIEYTAIICAAPIHLEENEGPTSEIVTIDRKELY